MHRESDLMSNIVRLSNRDWVGIVCTTVLCIGGLYKMLSDQQGKINELAITQAVTIAQPSKPLPGCKNASCQGWKRWNKEESGPLLPSAPLLSLLACQRQSFVPSSSSLPLPDASQVDPTLSPLV